MPPPLSSPRRAPPSRRNVAVLSHAEYVPTLTAAAALRVKAALRSLRGGGITMKKIIIIKIGQRYRKTKVAPLYITDGVDWKSASADSWYCKEHKIYFRPSTT